MGKKDDQERYSQALQGEGVSKKEADERAQKVIEAAQDR
jgi:hypothetical protein